MKVYTMADVCEKAHDKLEEYCNEHSIAMDCTSVEECGDEGNDHDDEEMTHYTREAQEIFDRFYDEVEQEYIKNGYEKE